MKRVTWLTQVFPRFEGDVLGGFLLRLARELRDWEVTVVAPAEDGLPLEEEFGGVRVERFDYGGGLAYRGEMHRAALKKPWALARLLLAFRQAAERHVARSRPALVHAHWWFPSGWVARGVARHAGLPWVVSLHGTDMRLIARSPVFRPAARWVLRAADVVLPVSTALDREAAALGILDERRVILPMPADAALFRPGMRETENSAARFLVVARLTRQKRVADVIEALAALRRNGQDVSLEIAGDGPERAQLEALARSRAVADRVVFHGLVPPERLADLYRRARALVLPSADEGYGLVLVEAALCGIPGIGARSGGVTDLIAPDRTGLLFEVGDVEGLTVAMDRLARDPDLARRLGEAGREGAAARTAGPLAQRLTSLYERLSSRT